MYSIVTKFLIISILLYKTVDAAVFIFPKEEKPKEFADEEGCYLSSLKRVLEVEVPYSPQDGTSCVQYTCRDNGETTAFTCGVLGIGEGCELVPGNKTLPYPDCCDSATCNNEDESDSE